MSKTIRTFAGALAPLTFLACSSYTPQPLETADLLVDLRTQQPPSTSNTLSPNQATSAALQFNPELLAVRESVGIADSMLKQAGVWPDINLSWGAVDWLVGRTSDDVLTGFSAGVPLFRPDERDALIANASASRELIRVQLLDAEWRLTRQVQHQYVALAAAQEQLQVSQLAKQLAAETVDFLQQSVDAGAATRFDLEMALLQDGEAQFHLLAAQNSEQEARLHFNALIGAQPLATYSLTPLGSLLDTWPTPQVENAVELTDLALIHRPEVLASQAQYQRAEAALQLESARQWPGLEIGTGIALQLPIFSGFNKRAVATARLQRDQAALEMKAAVAQVRNEAWMIFQQAQSHSLEWHSFDQQVSPRLEASLEMTRQAQQLGSLSYMEVLFAQRQLNNARATSIEVLAAHLLAQSDLAWFLGTNASLTEAVQ
jgi:outer membrane protein TolC